MHNADPRILYMQCLPTSTTNIIQSKNSYVHSHLTLFEYHFNLYYFSLGLRQTASLLVLDNTYPDTHQNTSSTELGLAEIPLSMGGQKLNKSMILVKE